MTDGATRPAILRGVTSYPRCPGRVSIRRQLFCQSRENFGVMDNIGVLASLILRQGACLDDGPLHYPAGSARQEFSDAYSYAQRDDNVVVAGRNVESPLSAQLSRSSR
jgi:hypothetical protein